MAPCKSIPSREYVTDPRVSVIMASYNAAPFVSESIESVLAQSYPSLELVVVDDASSDGTAEIVGRYAERLPDRVRLGRKQVREGPCRARNDALALTRGSLIGWLDQDDLWAPTKVEEQVSLLTRRPEVGLVYTYFDAFDSDTGQVVTWPDGRRDLEGDVLAPLLLLGCFIGSLTAMFRREALDRAGGRLRDRDFSIGDDYWLWLTIALDWQVARLPQALARYRRHTGNESSRVASEIDLARWRAALVQEFLGQFPRAERRLSHHDRAATARYLRASARAELRNGGMRQGCREGATAVRLDLLNRLTRASP